MNLIQELKRLRQNIISADNRSDIDQANFETALLLPQIIEALEQGEMMKADLEDWMRCVNPDIQTQTIIDAWNQATA